MLVYRGFHNSCMSRVSSVCSNAGNMRIPQTQRIVLIVTSDYCGIAVLLWIFLLFYFNLLWIVRNKCVIKAESCALKCLYRPKVSSVHSRSPRNKTERAINYQNHLKDKHICNVRFQVLMVADGVPAWLSDQKPLEAKLSVIKFCSVGTYRGTLYSVISL